MDLFSFDGLSIFDSEVTTDDGAIFEDQFTVEETVTYDDTYAMDETVVYDTTYGMDETVVYDTTYTVDETVVYDGQTTIDQTAFVDNTAYSDQSVFIDSTVYSDQATFADTTLYSDQSITVEAPTYNTEYTIVEENQIVADDTAVPGSQPLVSTPGTQFENQITTNESSAVTYSDSSNAFNETTINNQYIVNDAPGYQSTGYQVVIDQPAGNGGAYPVSQTYSNTSFEASVQAQYGVQPTAGNAQGQITANRPPQTQVSNANSPPGAGPGQAARPPGQPVTGNVALTQGGNQSLSLNVNPNVSVNVKPSASINARPTGPHVVRPSATQGHPTVASPNGRINGQNMAVNTAGTVMPAHNPTVLHSSNPTAIYGSGIGSQSAASNAIVSLGSRPTLPLKMGKMPSSFKHGIRLSSQGASVLNKFSNSLKSSNSLRPNLNLNGATSSTQGGGGIDVLDLAWKAGAYAYHRSNMKKQLALCLLEYCSAGYLELHQDYVNPKLTTWTTTAAFHNAKFLLHVYKDIEQYVKLAKISDAEMDALGWRNSVTIHAERKLPDVIQQLSYSCDAFGIRNVTQTDLEARLNIVSAQRTGVISLTNAFLIEAERRRQRELDEKAPEHHLVPILGRVLSLAAMCGIREIRLSDIATLLGKAPMFETVVRSRIAALRKHHASHILNSLLFGGSTESATRDFTQEAAHFKDQRIVVGRVVAPMTPKFDPPWAKTHCMFSGPVDANQAVGTPIYMLAGWARLVLQREQLPRGPAPPSRVPTQLHCTERDVHGNRLVHPGGLGQLMFTVKTLADGTLMAKPRKFDRFEYLEILNPNQNRANTQGTGEEKHFGGMVGPVHCGCVVDDRKGRLTADWKYSEELGIDSRVTVTNSLHHAKQMSTKKISILWSSGDWAKGVFLMQVLPQSSYLQGRGECLHCAIENAALAGCVEVIACGGGRVTAAAKNIARPGTIAVNPKPVQAAATAPTTAQVIRPSAPPHVVTVAQTPPPQPGQMMNPNIRPAGTPVENRPAGVVKTGSVRRKPIGPAAAANVVKKPVVQATISEVRPPVGVTTQQINGPRPMSVGGSNVGHVVVPTPLVVRKMESQVTVSELDELSVDLC